MRVVRTRVDPRPESLITDEIHRTGSDCILIEYGETILGR